MRFPRSEHWRGWVSRECHEPTNTVRHRADDRARNTTASSPREHERASAERDPHGFRAAFNPRVRGSIPRRPTTSQHESARDGTRYDAAHSSRAQLLRVVTHPCDPRVTTRRAGDRDRDTKQVGAARISTGRDGGRPVQCTGQHGVQRILGPRRCRWRVVVPAVAGGCPLLECWVSGSWGVLLSGRGL